MKKLFALFLIVGMLAGCATTTDVSLKRQYAGAARTARVFLVVSQDKVGGDIFRTTAGEQYGFIGRLVDTVVDAFAYKKVLRQLVPLQQATADLDFRRDLLLAIKNAGIFVNSDAIEVVVKHPRSDQEVDEMFAKAGDIPVVAIFAHYNLSADYTELQIDHWIVVRLTPRGRDVYTSHNHYFSRPISMDASYKPEPEIMIPRWAANNAAVFRAAYREGIDDTVKIIRSALLERPSNLPDQGKSAEGNPYSEGKVVYQTEERKTILTYSGSYRSVPNIHTFAELQPHIVSPSPGYGRAIFYRVPYSGMAHVQPTLYLNGTRISDLCSGTFFYRDLQPGRYQMTLRYERNEPGASRRDSILQKAPPADLLVSKDGHVFVKYDFKIGFWSDILSVQMVAEDVAMQEIGPLIPYQ